MSTTKSHGKTGWLQGALERLAAQETAKSSPDEDRIVSLPRNLDRLHSEIRRVQGELVHTQGQRGKIELAWADLSKEHTHLLAANEQQQVEIIRRLEGLQQLMADAVKECGIKAEIVETKVGG
jgi:chromosome segregation ATPase